MVRNDLTEDSLKQALIDIHKLCEDKEKVMAIQPTEVSAEFLERGGVIVPKPTEREKCIDYYMDEVVNANGIKLDHEDASHAPVTSCLLQEAVQTGPLKEVL